MAVYFFHFCDGGDTLLDPEGRQVDDTALIAGMALKDARGIISQDALIGQIHLEPSIEVRDEAGALIHELPFCDAVAVTTTDPL
jgi:hypothetical protein